MYIFFPKHNLHAICMPCKMQCKILFLSKNSNTYKCPTTKITKKYLLEQSGDLNNVFFLAIAWLLLHKYVLFFAVQHFYVQNFNYLGQLLCA